MPEYSQEEQQQNLELKERNILRKPIRPIKGGDKVQNQAQHGILPKTKRRYEKDETNILWSGSQGEQPEIHL